MMKMSKGRVVDVILLRLKGTGRLSPLSSSTYGVSCHVIICLAGRLFAPLSHS